MGLIADSVKANLRNVRDISSLLDEYEAMGTKLIQVLKECVNELFKGQIKVTAGTSYSLELNFHGYTILCRIETRTLQKENGGKADFTVLGFIKAVGLDYTKDQNETLLFQYPFLRDGNVDPDGERLVVTAFARYFVRGTLRALFLAGKELRSGQ